jgi:hypothetical protein
VACAAATAGATVQFRYERGLTLSQGRDAPARPVAVTCDAPTGDVCVTDGVFSALHLFNVAGVETFRTGAYAGLSLPNDGAVDPQGRLVAVAATSDGQGTIVRLDVYGERDGWTPERPAGTWRPTHLVVSRDGHYVTVDGTSGLMAKHDAVTGAVLWAKVIAKPGADDPDLDMDLGRPAQLPDGSYAVAGNNLHVVLLVSEDGEPITAFGRFGTSPGRMVAPVATAVGPGGLLLVLDQMRHKLMAFDGQHEFLDEYGSIGDAPGDFYHPVSMATDASGHVFVAQGYRSRVQMFSVLADGTVE